MNSRILASNCRRGPTVKEELAEGGSQSLLPVVAGVMDVDDPERRAARGSSVPALGAMAAMGLS